MKKISTLFILVISLISSAFAQPTFNKTFQFDTQTYNPSTEFYDVEEDGKFIYVLGDYRDYTPNAPSTSTSFVLTLNQSGNILHRKERQEGNIAGHMGHCRSLSASLPPKLYRVSYNGHHES